MILESLYLKNIRSYKSVDIDLTQGISLFEGDVGSGKSTILMAIEFAFFGLGNQRGESLLRKDEVNGEVMLSFEVNAEPVIIKRTLQRSDLNGRVSQGKGMLYFDGEKLELSPAELKEMVLDLIDFKEDVNPRANSHIFRYAVYTPQEEMKEIIFQRPDQRMQTLRKAFGVEEYKVAAENAGLLIKDFRDKQSFLSGKMERYDSLEEELSEQKRMLDSYENKLGKLIDEKVTAEEEFENIKGDVEGARELKQDLEKLELKRKYNEKLTKQTEADIEKTVQKIEELENYIETIVKKRINQFKDIKTEGEIDGDDIRGKIDRVEDLISSKIDKEAKLEILETQADSIITKMGKYSNTSQVRFNTEKNKALAKIEEIETKENDIKVQISANEGHIHSFKTAENGLIDKHDKLIDIKGSCPTCNADLTEEKKEEILKEMEDEIDSLGKKGILCKKELDKLTHELKKAEENKLTHREKYELYSCLEKEAKELEDKEDEMSKLREEINGYKLPMVELGTDTKGYANLGDYLKDLRKKLDNVKQFEINKQRLREAEYDLKKTEKNISALKSDIEDKNKELKALETDWLNMAEKHETIGHKLENMGEIGEEYDLIEKQLNNVQQNITSCKTNIQSKTERITGLEYELADLEEAKKKQTKFEEYTLWVQDYFIPTVKTIEKNILSELFVEFNNTFKDWFDVLVDDETKSARLDNEFTPMVEQGGMAQEINYLSGGEKTSVALAYRLALNRLVKKVSVGMETNLLILDEPTDGLSKEQLFKLREILDKMECEQIIMVSHERELEGFADKILHVEKENGVSRVEEIE